MEFTLLQIANLIDGTVEGDVNAKVHTFSKIEEGKAGSISFLSNPKYETYIYTTDSTAVIVSNDFCPSSTVKSSLIKVKDPYSAISNLMSFYQQSISKPKTGIEQPSYTGTEVKIGQNVYLAAFSYIDDYSIINDSVHIFANAYIGKNVIIGKNSVINAGVKIYDGCIIGENCILHSGCVIGSDGFGFAPNTDRTYTNIPQLGNVILGNNVNVGANTCIDRATMGSTIIADGVKLDNLVQIGHNVEIGINTVIAAQTGVAGSTKIGENCVIAGQVGFAGHIKIANGTKIGGQSAVTKSIKVPNQSFAGRPLMAVKDYLRMLVTLKNI